MIIFIFQDYVVTVNQHIKSCFLRKDSTIYQQIKVEANQRDGTAKPERVDGYYPCPYEGCEIRSPTPHRLQEHERTHTGERPYECPVANCGWAFAKRSTIKKHVLQIHKYEKDYLFFYSCEGCGRRFKRLTGLEDHGAYVHSESGSRCAWQGGAKHGRFTPHARRGRSE